MEHVLKIRLQFEDLTAEATRDLKKATKTIETEQTKGMQRAAQAGREEWIRTMTSLSEAWKNFDWAHPIKSMKDLLSGVMDWIGQRFGKLGQIVVAGLLAPLGKAIISAFKQTIDAQDELVRMYAQLGDVIDLDGVKVTRFGEKISRSLQDITGVAMTTGAAISQVTAIYTTLGKMRVPTQDLKEMSRLAVLGGAALGANVDQLSQLMGQLRVTGQLSMKQLGPQGMLGEFLKVQAAIGLTETEMTGMLAGVSKIAQRMTAFPTATKDILAMSTATAKLTGMFGKLGLEASRGAEVMEQLFDPNRIGENALMVRSMGMSMKEYMDMLAGGTVDQEKMTGGLVRAAQQIQDMQKSGVNAFALQQRAQLMGFKNAQEALRIAKDGDKILSDVTGKTADLQAQAAEGMSSLKNAFQTLGNTVTAALAKPLAGLMGRLTDVVNKLTQVFLRHMPAIEKGLTSFFNGVMQWVDKGGIETLVESLKSFGKIIGNIVKVLPKLLPIIAILAGSFLALKFVGPMLGGITKALGGFGKTLGGLFGKLKGAGGMKESLGGVSKGLSGFAKSLQGFVKLIMAGAAMLLIAGALWVLSDALNKFNTVKWESLAKAGVVLLTLIGIMIGLGFLLGAGPVGAALAAGIIVLAGLGIALAAFAGGLLLLNMAIKSFDIEPLIELASLASMDLVKGLALFGLALAAMVAPLMLLGPLAAIKFVLIAKGLKDLAIGMFILSKTPDLKGLRENLNGLRQVLVEFAKSNLRGVSSDVGAGFKDLTAGITDLTKLDTSKFKNIGRDMMDLSKGIGDWMQQMKEGAGAKVLWGAFGKDVEGITKGFKDLAIGVYILGMASDKMGAITAGIKALSGPVAELMKGLTGVSMGYGMETGGTAFSVLSDALGKLTNLPAIIGPMEKLPYLITAIGGALGAFGSASANAGKFVQFMKDMQNIKNLQIEVKAPTEVPITGKLAGVQGDLTQTITMTFAAETAKVVSAIGALKTVMEDSRDRSLIQLSDIVKYTRQSSKG